MNRFLVILFLGGFLCSESSWAQAQKDSSPVITERGVSHRIWESYSPIGSSNGEVLYRTNTVVELASGLHYWDGTAWVDSREEIEIVGNKAVARKGNHKVAFAGNIATAGAIQVTTAEGGRFRSQVAGLSYYDAKTGASVLIAEVKSADGFVLPPNQVIYVDAFTDIQADVVYTYTKAGLEQDVILREAPPSPAEYGLNPETTRLEVLTEFLEAPEVRKEKRVVRPHGERQQGARFASPDFIDEALDFGVMKMGAGKAFHLEANGRTPANTIPVGKQWERMEGRDFLIEAVPYDLIHGYLANLPPVGAEVQQRIKAGRQNAAIAAVHNGEPRARAVPKRVASIDSNNLKAVQIANFQPREKGVVLDYLLLSSSATNMTFAGDTTYLVSGEVVLEGTTTFEGGAVIKYTNNVANARLRIKGPSVWDTAPYRPVVFTALDDNSVGEAISGSTGVPTNYYASTALLFDNGQQNDLKHVRITHAATAVDSGSLTVTHGQFVNSGNGISLAGNNFALRNVLFSGVQTNIYSSLAITGLLEHVSVNGASYFASCSTNSYLAVTNSLFYSITNYGAFSWVTNQVALLSGGSPFQILGAGSSYLLTNSPYRNIGSTNIDSSLKAEFALLTTEPPVVLTNAISTNMILAPIVARDTNQPDLGYHYYAVDYALGTLAVSNATISMTNGVVCASFTSQAIWLREGSSLQSDGAPLRPNRFCRYTSAQDQPVMWGTVFAAGATFNPNVSGGVAPTVRMRFTEFSSLNNDTYFFTGSQNNTNWQVSDLQIRDCSFYGGTATIDRGGQTNTSFILINNLFKRVALKYTFTPTNTYAFNNIHDGGLVQVRFSTNAPTIRDSIFKETIISKQVTQDIAADYNAYLGQTNRINTAALSDIVTNLIFVEGPLGKYYQPTNSPLINAGSQSATNVGLYHYTILIDQTKEAGSVVDMGLHYVSLDIYGNPADSDGDGIPDYLEDRNGDGVAGPGETDWSNQDTDGDGLSDSLELRLGRNPLVAGKVADTGGVTGLKVFTPVK